MIFFDNFPRLKLFVDSSVPIWRLHGLEFFCLDSLSCSCTALKILFFSLMSRICCLPYAVVIPSISLTIAPVSYQEGLCSLTSALPALATLLALADASSMDVPKPNHSLSTSKHGCSLPTWSLRCHGSAADKSVLSTSLGFLAGRIYPAETREAIGLSADVLSLNCP